MATHKLAILVDAIGAAKAARDLKGVDSAVSSIGAHAGRGIRTAARNLAGVGAIATAGIAVAVKTGLQDLATLESAVTSVDGAIRQMGLTGQVTGGQVAGWANEIEAAVGAAFDDKDITAATATLIRYGKVTESNLRPAMVVMTDLAAKTGSVESASSLLAKALADPAKAAGKLTRQGIILTAAQQKQIKAFVKAGEVGKAQKVILDAVAKSTKGAAEASQGAYARSLSVLSDVAEDARKALAEGFLPVIEKVSDLLGKELAKPQTLANIREFGQGLANGLDDLISIARNLPWDAIGTSLKIGGAGAKAVLEAFSNLPPWVQTAVATGWGLNKLTGGALSGIVGELGKGLIKGVLGMNAGVVNINAGIVKGGPGGGLGDLPGKIGGGAAAAGGLTLGGAAAIGLGSLTVGFIAADVIKTASGQTEEEWQRNVSNSYVRLGLIYGSLEDLNRKTQPNGPVGGAGGVVGFGSGRGSSGQTGTTGWAQGQFKDVTSNIQTLKHDAVGAIGDVQKGTEDVKRGTLEVKQATGLAAQQVMGATRMGAAVGAMASTLGASRVVSAIAANRPIVTVSTVVNVTASSVTSSQTSTVRTGSSGGSRSNDNYNDHR